MPAAVPPLRAFRWAINLPYGMLRCIRSSTAKRLAAGTSYPGGLPRGASGAGRHTAISLSSLRAFSGL